MSSKQSFFFGLVIASIVWAICLYIYMNALQPFESPTITPAFRTALKKANQNGNQIHDVRRKVYKKYINSDKLLNELQPVTVNLSSSNFEQLGMVRNEEDKLKRDSGYQNYAYNVLVSEAIGFTRELPDTRNTLCLNEEYSDKLPNASIIICFYNEHLTTLLRTVHSILDRTPKHLLNEIILVDDYSELITLHSDVERYISQNFDDKVKLYKTDRREGLIRARIFGADKASGDVLVFLDSHVEVNRDWLQPLLQRISISKTIVTIPVIDIINSDTFAYGPSPLVRGGFNWGLHYKWDNLPKNTLSTQADFVKPIKTPTMAGGLFAMNRNYFYDLGTYDRGMDIWGGENIEISFRTWMCGGSLEIIPCSRVGHVFRRRRPYGNPNGVDTMIRNSLRVAHVWMDDYKDFFLNNNQVNSKLSFGDISERVNLREKLKCKSFDWYLREVYPELELPSDNKERLKKKWSAVEQNQFQPWHLRKRNYIDRYQLKYSNSSLCLGTVKDTKSKGGTLSLQKCKNIKKQYFYETDKSEIVVGQLLCLEATDDFVRAMKCHEMGGNQEWKQNQRDHALIYNMAGGMCLGIDQVEENEIAKLVLCSKDLHNQWNLVR